MTPRWLVKGTLASPIPADVFVATTRRRVALSLLGRIKRSELFPLGRLPVNQSGFLLILSPRRSRNLSVIRQRTKTLCRRQLDPIQPYIGFLPVVFVLSIPFPLLLLLPLLCLPSFLLLLLLLLLLLPILPLLGP